MLPSFTGNPDKLVKTAAPIVALGATAMGLSSSVATGAVATGVATASAAGTAALATAGAVATAAAPIVLPALAVWGIWKLLEADDTSKKK